MTVFETIKTLLDERGITYALQHHEATPTSADSARVRGMDLHTGAKALVMRGKKTNAHMLFVMPADLRFDAAKAKALLGEPVTFADDPETVTGCVKGSVPPLGSVIGLKTYCDARLAENAEINFNAGSLTDSVTMRYADYVAIENPEIVDITQAAA